MHIYLTDSNVKLGLSGGRLTVKTRDGDTSLRDFLFADVEGISVFGMAKLENSLVCAIEQRDPTLYQPFLWDEHFGEGA